MKREPDWPPAPGRHPCDDTLALQTERVAHFKRRVAERGESPQAVVIVLINVDDVHGRDMADALMPGQEAMWQGFRDQGQTPFARGLAGRAGVQRCLDFISAAAGAKLRAVPGLAVVVIDHGTAAVYEA